MNHQVARFRTGLALAASLLALILAFAFPQNAFAANLAALGKGDVRIHVLPFDYTDAIIVECDGHFGVVDSGEDSLSPDGSDFRYPVRSGTTEGQGIEAEVIAYMKKIGVTQQNLDFYIGTHPHSDHIGSASQIIHEFHPKTIYTPLYDDSYITSPSCLWDNQFVYDRLLAAAAWAQSSEGYGARFIQHLDPTYTDSPDPDESGKDEGTEGGSTGGSEDGSEGEGEAEDGSSNAADAVDSTGSTDPTDPIDPTDPTNPTDPEDPKDPKDEHTASPVFNLGSATIEIVNYGEDYQTTKVPDANYFSYGVKVTAQNGRTAFLAGDMNNFTDGDAAGVGDEDRLKTTLGQIDFLKMAHHGLSGSNTPDYLRTVLKATVDGNRSVVVQTGPFFRMPWETVQVLNEKGARHFQAAQAAIWGNDAFVADLTASGVETNCDGSQDVLFQIRNDAPYACLYRDGLPYATTGWVEGPDGNHYFFGEPGVDAPSSVPATNRWATYEGDRVFIGNQGYKALGWQKIEGVWYYFNSDGSLRYGWQQVSGKWYYLDPQTGAMQTGWKDLNSKRYYFDPQSGAMVTGWVDIDGGRYYFDANGAMTSGQGWVKNNNTWYYATPSGKYKTGWLKDKGTWYYLKESGAMATGWLDLDGTWYYLNGSGAMQTGWKKLGNTWYHLKSSGAMTTGWLKDKGTWYYLNPKNGAMATGWADVEGTWYYLNASGAMQTGWKKLGNTWYHLKSSGAMTTGWLKDKGTWYYLKESGAMATGWLDLDGTWYYLNGSGAMQTGWQKVGGTWYHLKGSGAMSVGWLDDKGKRYYLRESGAMVTGTQVIDGETYTFGPSGALR